MGEILMNSTGRKMYPGKIYPGKCNLRRMHPGRRSFVVQTRKLAVLCAIAAIAVFAILLHNFGVQAVKPAASKYYTDIRVDRGDTLWDIASRYITDDYKSMNAYIREIRQINHLGMDLQYGQILVIPYYSYEMK